MEATVEIGSNGGITDVTLKGEGETPDVGGAAIPLLRKAILDAQSSEVDSVSGATFTSDGVKAAVTAALAQAGGGEGAVSSGPKAAEGNTFIPGTYTETATGFGGEVSVTVKVSENSIDDVQITGDHETENIGSFAVSMLGDRILEAQSPNVDALTGATVTSNAILSALKKALTAAGADLSTFPAKEDRSNIRRAFKTLDTDIVIVGAGGAGMTAAINAAQAGKNVILVEKMPYAGGNTTKATGGMNAAETHYQAEQGIEDSVEQFVEDTIKGGHDINDRDLVTIMAENSAEGIEWLDSIGAPLPKISFSGGATNQRIHAPEDGSGVGAYLVTAMLKKIEVDPATLAQTLETWNKAVADKNDAEFGRNTGMDNDLSTAPYYAIKIAPGIHHTMGGVHINTSAEVIDTNDKAIPGLFAAGEVVGGVHGGNRLGGNAVADIVVFGRIASDSAVKYCDEK